MRHTPGPWKYNGRSRAVYAGNNCVANLGRYVSPLTDDSDANCRLVAAAPVLLEACRSALSALKVLSPPCYDGMLGDELRRAIEQAGGYHD